MRKDATTLADAIRPIADLVLGTFLRSRGHRIRSIDRDGTRSVFLFESNPDLEKDILRFYNGDARVEPLGFYELLKSLKGAAMQHGAIR